VRLETLKLRNIGAFREFAVDLTSMPGPLVAITGPNGAGKSTLLELGLPGAMYRETPTRGSLVDLATARDALVEARLVNGAPWTIRHLVDKVSGKSEAAVFDAAGAAVLPDTKVRSFDAWAAKHLPSPEVLYACMFAPQGADGFLGAKPGERKAVLLRLLGIEHYEALAKAAAELARTERSRLEGLVARIADEKARGGDVAACEAELESARADVESARALVTAARAELEAVTEALRGRSEEERLARERQARRDDLSAKLKTGKLALEDLDERIRNNRAVLAQSKEIRAAVADAERLRTELHAARTAVSVAESEAKQLAVQVRDAARAREKLAARIQRAKEALAARAEVDQAVAAIPDLEAKQREAVGAVGVAEDVLEDLQSKRAAGSDERIGSLRIGLRLVADGRSPDPQTTARTALDEDDRLVREASELPSDLEKARRAVAEARQRAQAADQALSKARAVAARASAIATAETDLAEAQAELEKLNVAALETKARERDADRVEAEQKAARLRSELEPIAKLAAKAEPLAGAEGRLAELEPAAEAKRAELHGLGEQLAQLPPLGTPPPLSDAEARAAVATRERELREAEAAVVRATTALERARATEGRLAELERERAGVEAELADWTRLAGDLGRDGLQALEIDAAGPELTELVNDLLHSCHGPRWTVRVETQRLSADGKRQLEGCDVMVLDTVGGREAEGSTFSGGERVMIGEALSLALSMLACRRAGLDRPTLVRDESGAALDPENARVYVAMLRRAAQLVGADKVLFVSHDPAVQALADSRIEVRP
jgi:exonuclease SbcC